MSDLISRQAALNSPVKMVSEGLEWIPVYHIRELPTVDAVPVRHGRWETVEDWDGDEHYMCSECKAEYVLIDGTPRDNDYLYCPNCGARMDGRGSGNG